MKFDLAGKKAVVTGGSSGIGKAIDEIMLNVAVFKQLNVPIMGVIINKVFAEKYDKINKNVKINITLRTSAQRSLEIF